MSGAAAVLLVKLIVLVPAARVRLPVWWVAEAAGPVTVIVNVPVAVVDVVATVSVELPPDVTDVGENVTDEPAGPPDALNATDSALPDVTAVEIVDVTVPPSATEAEAGL